jgi:hypothetical protein
MPVSVIVLTPLKLMTAPSALDAGDGDDHMTGSLDNTNYFDRIEDNSGPVMADRTLALVRKIMNWHASRSDEFRSPIVMGMARTRPKERERDRVLSDEEIRAVWGIDLIMADHGT